jgi:hypothetical protein
MALLMEGAMQQAAQAGRQFMSRIVHVSGVSPPSARIGVGA